MNPVFSPQHCKHQVWHIPVIPALGYMGPCFKWKACSLFCKYNYVLREITLISIKKNSLFSQMYQKVKGRHILTVDDVRTVLQNKFPHADILDILGTHSKYDSRRKVRVDILQSKIPGTRAIHTLWLPCEIWATGLKTAVDKGSYQRLGESGGLGEILVKRATFS